MEFLVAIVTLVISIGLIVAIFQINSRLDRIRQLEVKQLAVQEGFLLLERFRFMKALIHERRLSDEYLNLLVSMGVLPQADADWLRQVRSEIQKHSNG